MIVLERPQNERFYINADFIAYFYTFTRRGVNAAMTFHVDVLLCSRASSADIITIQNA